MLNGSNTFTGTVNVNSGTIELGNKNALGATNTAVTKINIASGGTVDLKGTVDVGYGYTIAGTGATGAGALINTGSAIGNGYLQTTNVKLAADATIGGTGDFALLASGYGATSLDLAGHTLTKSGTNTFTLVNTTLTAGSINIASGTVTQYLNSVNASSVAFSLANTAGATLSLGNLNLSVGSLAGGGTTGGNVSLGSATLTVGSLGTSTSYAGVISGTGALTKTGSGTQILSGANTYTGVTTISAGTLQAGSASAFTNKGDLQMSGSGVLDLGGNAVGFNNASASATTNTITNNGAVSATLNFANLTTQINSLIQDGSKPLAVSFKNDNSGSNLFKLDSPNTFSGGVTILDGVGVGSGTGSRLRISNLITTVGFAGAIVSSPFGTGSITIGQAATDKAGILFDTTANNTLANAIVFNTALGTDQPGMRVDTAATGLVLSGRITANLANALFSNGTSGSGVATVNLTGQVTGASGLQTNASAIVVNLNNSAGTNDYAGDTTIGTGSSIVLGRANQVPNGAGKGNMAISGTFNLNGFSETINGLSGAGTVEGASGTPTLTLGDNNASSTFSGTIKNTAGTLALTKIGTGTQILSGTNTYTGATTITTGTLQVNGSIASGSTVAVGTSGTLGGSGTINGNATLTGGGVINLSNPGVISGTLGVTGGNWNGAGSVTGAVTSSSGTFTIGSGANLTANGGLSITGGSIAAGSATGTITGNVNYTSASSSTYAGAIAGTGNTLTMNNASAILSLTSSSSYTGGTNIIAGVVAIGLNNGGVGGDSITGGTSSGLGTGAVNVAAGASLHLNQSSLTIANNITLNGMSYGTNSGGPAATNAGPWNGALMGDSLAGVVSNTINGTITLNATSNITTNWNDKTLILAGNVTGVGGLVIDNSAPNSRQGGIIRLSNTTNDYQGDTTINNGNSGAQPTLTMGAANVLPSGVGKGNMIVNGNFDMAGYNQSINGLSGVGSVFSNSASATLSVGNNSASSTFSGTISNGSGSLAITKVGGGSLVLSGSNSYSGATTVSAGVLNIQNANALGSTASGTTVSSGAALQIQGSIATAAEGLTLNGTGVSSDGALRNINGTNSYAGLVTLGSATRINSDAGTLTLSNTGAITGSGLALTVGGAGNTTINSIIGTGTGTLTKDGSGTVILNGANTYTGTTTLSAGILNIQNATGLGTTAGGTTVSNGATLQLQGGITVGAEALSLNGGSASGQTGALVNVSGTNTYGGAITVTSSSSISAASGSVLNLTGGVVKNGTVATFNGGGTINVNTVAISGSSANSDLVIDGTTVNLGVANTYNGPTFIRNGATLNANVANALPTANGRTDVTFDGTGTSVLALGADQSVASLTSAGAATVTLNANTLTVGAASGSTTFAGAIGGTGGLIKDGASTLVLSGNNGYTGATTVSAGRLTLQGTYGSSGFAISSGATLEFNTGSSQNYGTTTFSGAGTFQKTGTGEIRWGPSAATFALTSGSLIDIQGGLMVGGNFANEVWTNNKSDLNIASGAFFAGVEANVRVNALNGGGTLSTGFSGSGYTSLTLGVDNGGGTFSGSITNGVSSLGGYSDFGGAAATGNLTKVGTGTQILSGSNSYTGSTTVSAGTLSISGDINASTTLSISGGTLSTTGANKLADTAAVTVSGGTLTVGGADTVSTLSMSSGTIGGSSTLTATTYGLSGGTVNGNLGTGTINSSGTVALNGTAGASTVNVTAGTLTLGASSTLNSATTVAISGGSLVLGASSQIGSSAAVTVSGGTLALGSFSDTVSSVVLSSGGITGTTGVLTSSSAYDVRAGSVSAILGGSVGLNKTTAGTVTLSGSNTYTGTTAITGGTLKLQSGAATPSGVVAYYQFNNSGNLGVDSSTQANNLVTGTGSPAYTSSGKYGGALYLNGSSTMQLSGGAFPSGVPTGSNPYTVAAWIKADTGCALSGGWIGYGNNSTNQGNNFRLNGANNSVWEYWYFNDMAATMPSGNFFDGWHYVVGTWDGTTEIIYIDGVQIASRTPSGLNVGTGIFVVGKTTADANWTGWIDDLLIANRAFSPAEVVAQMNESGAANVLATTTPVQISSGATLDLNGVTQTVKSLADSGGAGGSVTNSSSTPLTLTVNPTSGSNSFSGIISDSGSANAISFVKTGAGTQIFSGANSYTGTTTVSAGVLNIQNANALGSTTAGTSVTSGAALQIQGGITTVAEALTLNGTGVSNDGALRNISGTNSYAGLVTLGSATRINSDAGTLTLSNSGTITGAFGLTVGGAGDTVINSIIGTTAGGLTKDGTGTLTLTGANTYSGSYTTVSAGTLKAGANNVLPGTLQVMGTGTLDLNGFNATASGNVIGGAYSLYFGVNSAGQTSTLSTGAGTLTLNGNVGMDSNAFGTNILSGNVDLGGAVRSFSLNQSGTPITLTASAVFSNGGITKSGGAGMLVLSSSNTYSGATTVSAGTLSISGDINSSTTLTISGGVLSTTGADKLANTAAVTVSGGTLTVGGADTVGTLSMSSGTIGGSATLTATTYNLSGGTVTGNLGTGTINSSGTVALNGTAGATAVNVTAGTLTLGASSAINSATTLSISGGSFVLGASNQIGDSAAVSVSGGTLAVGANSDTVGGVVLTSGSITGSTGVLTSTSTYDMQGGSVSAILGGTVGLTKTTAGTVTLSGANTYTGATTITAGTLQVTGSLAAGSTVGIGTAGTLSGAGTVNGNATLTGSGIINLTNPGVIGGTLGVTGGNWNGAGSVTGLVTSSSGTFTIGSGANLTANGGLSVTGGTIASGSSTSTITGSVNYTSASSSTFGGVIAGSGNTLTLNNAAATLTLTGANTYTGTTTITAGVVNIQNANALGTTAAGTSVASGAALQIQGGIAAAAEALTLNGTGASNDGALRNISGTNSYAGLVTLGSATRINSDSGTLTLSNSGTITGSGLALTVGGAGNTTINSVIGTGTGTLTKDGAGTLLLTNASTFTGSVNVSAGTLQIGGTGNILSSANSSTVTVASGATALLSGSANNALGYTGTEKWVVAGTVSSTGGGAQTLPIGGLTLNGGSLTSTADNATFGAFIANGDSGTVTANGTGNTISGTTFGINGTNNTKTLAVLTPLVGDTLAISSVIKDVGGHGLISKTGLGTLTLSGANTYSGATTVGAGILSINTVNTSSNAQALGEGSVVNLGAVGTSSGTLTYTGGAGTLDKTINALGNGGDTVQNSGTGLLTLSGSLVKTGTVLTLKGGSNGITVSGVISGNTGSPNSDLVIDGGAVTLTNANTYNGPTFIRNGATLNANVTNALPTANGRTDVTFDGTGTLTLSLGADQSVASLTAAGAATVTLNSNTLTVGAASGSTTFAGAIGGTGGLIKDGASTLMLSGTNGYTGATTLSAGNLVINGSIGSSTLTTINGGTLLGTGTVGAIQLNSSGALNPGGVSTAGTLSTGNLSIVDGQLVFNLGGASRYSKLSTTGSINLTAGGTGAQLVLNAISGYAATLGDSFTLVSNNLTNTISGAFAKGTFGGTKVVTLTGVDYVQGLLGSNYYGRITYNSGAGNDLVLKVVTPVMTITQSGTGVAAGSTYSFGSVDKLVPSVPLTKTFTIKNDGGVDLMGIVVNAPTGAAASDYSIDLTGTASTLPPGSSTTFTVTFNPSRIGTRTAAIAIASNDLTNNPFNITLSGVGSIARNVTDGWTVAYAGPDAPGTLRNGMTKAVAVQKSTTSDTAVAVFATGYTSSAAGGQDIYTAKYDPVTGALLWAKTFNGAANLNDQGSAIAVDSSGNVVITGYTTKTSTDTDVYVAKYASSDGTLLWQKTYAGAGNNIDVGVGVAVDASDNVAVVGYGVNASAGMDVFAARYSADGSTTYFTKLIDGGNQHTDEASSVALNSAGNLVVAGYASNASNNKDFLVMQLDATTGSTQWKYTFNGSVSADDQAYSVAVNAADEAVATGYVRSSTYDLYTVKLSSSGSLVWQKQWNGPYGSSDAGYKVVVDSNSDVIVGGTSYRSASLSAGYVAKYSNADGTLVWERRFDGTASLQDSVNSLDVDVSNNVVATGYLQNSAGNYDVQTSKMFAADGSLAWQKLYNNAASKDDVGVAVAISPDGNVYAGGYATESAGTTDFLVKNYQTSTASVQTSQTITFANPGTQSAGTPLTLSASSDSGLTVFFSVVSGPAQIDSNSNTLLNFTGNGSVTVRASQGGSSTYAAATPVDQTFTVNKSAQTISFTLPANLASTAQWPLTGVASSGLAVTYSVTSGPASISSGVLSFTAGGSVTVTASQAGDARFNAATDVSATVTVDNHSPVVIFNNITENWRDIYAGSGAGQGTDIALQLSGNEAVAGFVGGYTTTSTGKDLYLAKYLENGTLAWSVTSGTTGDDEAMAVDVDGNGDVYVTGYVTTGTGQDVYVAKYSGSAGTKLWSYTYNGTGNSSDVGVSLDFDGTTNVVVGAYVVSSGTSDDFFAAKLNQSTGAVVWTSVQNRSGTTADVPAKVVVGTDGSVVLGGISSNDAWTVKLAAADGTRVWQQVYNFANKPDGIRGLALDASNNVFIAAYSQSANYDMYTAKYAALDGTLIWGVRYNSSYNSSDAPWDMVVDQNANVYVSGTSYRSSSLRDAMTLKYSGLDGTLQWQSRYNANSSGSDENYSVSIDGIGNPVSVGYTTTSNGTTDVTLLKNNKSSGSNTWQTTFDGGSNKNDTPKKVKVDPNGNVWTTGVTTGSSGQLELFIVRHMPTL